MRRRAREKTPFRFDIIGASLSLARFFIHSLFFIELFLSRKTDDDDAFFGWVEL